MRENTTDTRKRLAWYARRLRTMSPGEIAWRLRREGGRRIERLVSALGDRRQLPSHAAYWEASLDGFRRAQDRPVLLDRDRAGLIATDHPGLTAELVSAAEDVLAGRVRFFGYPEVELGQVIEWNHDPLSGYRWPSLPAVRIDHRTAPADPKWIWELNRLQYLPWLAEAWLSTGREEFANRAFELLDTWLDQNPLRQGIAWRGAFEAGVRAISVLVALQGLRDAPGLTPERYRRVVKVLEASGRACWRERSRFSSANNHLVGEIAGLATIALLLPDLPQADQWRTRALGVLEKEAARQILPDGMGAEQAVGYQMFTVELVLVVMTLLRAGGSEPPPALISAVRRSSTFLAAVVGQGDPAPRYGDDDEGFALRLGPEAVRTVADHLAIVAAYGGPGAVLPTNTASGKPRTTLTAVWVGLATAAGPPVTLLPQGVETSEPGSFAATDGGLIVLREAGRRLTVDVGPLGYLSLAAHGHADALSLTYSEGGHELIGDPGTGSYYGHPDWRRVHRGTAVHATVTIDEKDQSEIAGPFMWSEKAHVRVREIDLERGIVDAEHDGYQRLEDPVTHRRWVRAGPGGAGFMVLDVVCGRGAHRMAVSWPLAPELTAASTATGHLVSRDGVPVFQVAAASTHELVHAHVVGDETTHRGWWADRLEARRPAYLLASTCTGEVPLVVASVVRPVGGVDGALPVSELAVRVSAGDIEITWSENGTAQLLSVET